VVARGLIGLKLDLRDLYMDLNYKKSKNRNNNTVAPHVLSVCTRYITIYNKANDETSDDALKIEPHSERSVTEESSN
jgi:hypothetical protein